MKKKFFSLLNGTTVHLTPQTKFIPAEDFSKAVDSFELLTEIKKDALKYREDVAFEIEQLKMQAQREGFEEGFKAWVEKIEQLESEISKVRQETEKVILPVALKAAKKIVAKELETSENAIIEIVSSNLKAVATHKRITIYVNKKDLESLERNKESLKKMFDQLEVFNIRERADVEQGGCVIETEGGIINARLENQWKILESAFEKMMKIEK